MSLNNSNKLWVEIYKAFCYTIDSEMKPLHHTTREIHVWQCYHGYQGAYLRNGEHNGMGFTKLKASLRRKTIFSGFHTRGGLAFLPVIVNG